MCDTKDITNTKLDRLMRSMDRLAEVLERFVRDDQSDSQDKLAEKLTPGACGAEPLV
jgi:hypothetical protein